MEGNDTDSIDYNLSEAWHRDPRIRIRPACRADLMAIGQAIDSVEQPMQPVRDGVEPSSLLERFPDYQFVLEWNHRIIGLTLGYPVTISTQLRNRHQGHRSLQRSRALPPRPDDAGRDLWSAGMIWQADRQPVQNNCIGVAVQISRLTLLDRLDLRRSLICIPFEPIFNDLDLSPEAYLQQVKWGAIEDPRLSPLIAKDFVLRGYWSDNSGFQAMLTGKSNFQ